MVVTDYCKKWVKYAKNDIRIAQTEMGAQVNPRHRAYEVVLYHCQQAAEKMLKAYLISQNDNPWGHDLDNLRTDCAVFDSDFNGTRIISHCNYLNAFVAARYPDFKMSVDASNATRGLNSAMRVFDFVAVKLELPKAFFT